MFHRQRFNEGLCTCFDAGWQEIVKHFSLETGCHACDKDLRLVHRSASPSVSGVGSSIALWRATCRRKRASSQSSALGVQGSLLKACQSFCTGHVCTPPGKNFCDAAHNQSGEVAMHCRNAFRYGTGRRFTGELPYKRGCGLMPEACHRRPATWKAWADAGSRPHRSFAHGLVARYRP